MTDHIQAPAPSTAVDIAVAEVLTWLHARAAEIIDHRADVAQRLTALHGGYCPDELPLSAELAAVDAQIAAAVEVVQS